MGYRMFYVTSEGNRVFLTKNLKEAKRGYTWASVNKAAHAIRQSGKVIYHLLDSDTNREIPAGRLYGRDVEIKTVNIRPMTAEEKVIAEEEKSTYHDEITEAVELIKKLAEKAETLADLKANAARDYKTEDMRVNDLLHRIEFEEISSLENSGILVEIKNARMQRRVLKDQTQILDCYLSNGGLDTLRVIASLLNTLNNREYTPRVRDEIAEPC